MNEEFITQYRIDRLSTDELDFYTRALEDGIKEKEGLVDHVFIDRQIAYGEELDRRLAAEFGYILK